MNKCSFHYVFKHYFFKCNHILVATSRFCHGLSLWDVNLNTDTKIAIEKHWKTEVSKPSDHCHQKDVMYILSMFPYPSGNLHLGHARVYSISDTISRFHKMNDKNVLHPMGWDAFGLPAENAALERKIPPKDWTQSNINTMKNQLHQLGFNFNWDSEIATCDPYYYKWTQYIFLKLYENGLAYKSKAMVNWDPVDATVLADEQVDLEGRSWRSGAKVQKKLLSQWFVKTTKFSKILYDGLNDSSLENWRDITNLQKHWIGECNGLNVKFKVKCSQSSPCESIDVWSSDLKKFISPAFITVSSSNILAIALHEHCYDRKLPITCVNPLTNEELPVYVIDSIEYPEGRDIYIASPCCSEADSLLSQTVSFTEKCLQTSFHQIDTKEILNKIKEVDCAMYPVSSKLRDWLVSRQRYWGTPIPIIHCPDCGIVPVPLSELPVRLPDFDPSKQNQNLSENKEWVNCFCPRCNAASKRETDTLDTFVDSSWYFLRYLDPKNDNLPFDKEIARALMPVDLYIGGKEHAVLHLYYARFMNYFLHHIGWVPHPEPFKKLLVQGMIMGKSYKTKSSGKYLPFENVEEKGGKYFERGTMEAVSVQWEKMSKSKYNGENPQSLITKYGCDTTRLFLLADVAPSSSRNWSDTTFPGVLNWQHRLWLTIREFIQHRKDEELCNSSKLTSEEFLNIEQKFKEIRNYQVAAVTFCFRHTHQISVGITRLQSLTNTLRNKVPATVIARSMEYEAALSALVIMLAPLAPHFSSELWAGMRSARRLPMSLPQGSHRVDWALNVLDQTWPIVDEDFHLILTCKVDGAEKGRVTLPREEFNRLTLNEALSLARRKTSVSKRLERLVIEKTDFDHYPGCRATLNIHTNVHSKTEKVSKQESN